MPKDAIEHVRCYAPGAPTNSHTYEQIPLEHARFLVANGFAESFKHGTSIRLFARTLIKLRDRSCSWSHRLMELVAEGNFRACEMLRWMEERAA